tara:strand:+ start:72 stop:1823 length:1752 start_codon:yes stop_codon:yes gene_type:complete
VQIGIVGNENGAISLQSTIQQLGFSTTILSQNSISSSGLNEFSTILAIDHTGSSLFDQINKNINSIWIAIELGGVGGYSFPKIAGSISIFTPNTACYTCLQRRVKSNLSSLTNSPSQSQNSISPDFEPIVGFISAYLTILISNSNITHSHVFEVSNFSVEQIRDKNTATVTQRFLLPLPHCPSNDHCLHSPASGTPSERAEYAIDERIGIINTISEAESFPAPYYLSNLCETNSFSSQSVKKQAAGVAINWDDAFMKTAGESLERYSSGVYNSNSFISSSASHLENSISPNSFVQPTPDLYQDELIDWISGVDLCSNKTVYLPAEFSIFPPPSEYYKPAITTGLAIGNTLIEAQLSGLYEVIERDATMLSWYSTNPPPEFLPDSPDFDLLSRMASSQGLATTALLVTQDIDIPIVTVAVHRSSEWPNFAVGSCSNIDPNKAAIGALCEALQNWMELRSMGLDIANNQPSSIGYYSSFPKDAKSFLNASNSLLPTDIDTPLFSDSSEELSFIINHLNSSNLSAYSIRLTPLDIATIGFESVRIVIPEAQPLFFGKPFFGTRARNVPPSLGNFRSRLDRSPHPYP